MIKLIRTEQEGLKDLTIPYKGNIFSTPTPPFLLTLFIISIMIKIQEPIHKPHVTSSWVHLRMILKREHGYSGESLPSSIHTKSIHVISSLLTRTFLTKHTSKHPHHAHDHYKERTVSSSSQNIF